MGYPMDFELKKWDICYIDDVIKYANNKKIADNLRDGFSYPYTFSDAERFVIKLC